MISSICYSFAPEKGKHHLWRPPKAMDPSPSTSATGTWRFGPATGRSSMVMAANPEQTPRGSEGCLFVSNVFYFVHRLKNYTPKTTNQRSAKKISTYYVSFVSFVLKSACNQNPAEPGHEPPPKTRQAANFFLPNYQGILVRAIGVV